MTRASFEDFARIFSQNLHERSRTAKGVSDTSSNAKKRPLLKTGPELAAQVRSNTSELINAVWVAGTMRVFRALTVRRMMENWYDVINHGLRASDAYADEYARLEREAAVLRDTTGRNYRVNRRYRPWSVTYTKRNIGPLDLEFAMDKFYEDLVSIIFDSNFAAFPQARLLAFADREIDGGDSPMGRRLRQERHRRRDVALAPEAGFPATGFRIKRRALRQHQEL